MRWYADNSELNGIKDADIPDILLFGGVIIEQEAELQLCKHIDEIKARCGFPRAPIKWNMKDLKAVYKRYDRTDAYQSLLASSREWRRELFEAIAAVDCTILVACIEGYSSKRAILKERKNDLTRYVFSDALMRYGLHVRDKKPGMAHVVLDWPDKGISEPFDLEYACAFGQGQTSEGNVTYRCGKLSGLSFADSVVFTNMLHCQMLQVADFVVGATREFLECCMGKKEGGQGVDCLRIVRDKFRGAPANIVGWGLIVPTGNQNLRSNVGRGIRDILYSA